MAKYIPLDDVLEEIKRLHKEHTSKEYRDEAALVLEDLEDFLDSLKVKEIDLEKPFEGIKVQTSFESGSLDEIIVTTKYKAKKGE